MAQIKVSTARPSFRRAGITFVRGEVTTLDTSKLTKKQVEAIRAESMLSVRDVSSPKKGEADAAKKGEADAAKKDEADAAKKDN